MKKNIDRYILILIIASIIVMLFFYMKNTLTSKKNNSDNIDNSVSRNIEIYSYTLKNNKSDLYGVLISVGIFISSVIGSFFSMTVLFFYDTLKQTVNRKGASYGRNHINK